MLKGGWELTMVVCLVVGLVGASTAEASDAGLRKVVKYQTLLDKVNAGASKDSLKQSFVTLNKRISAAAKNETAALRLLSQT